MNCNCNGVCKGKCYYSKPSLTSPFPISSFKPFSTYCSIHKIDITDLGYCPECAPKKLSQGWFCPNCKKTHSPYVNTCPEQNIIDFEKHPNYGF